MQTQYYILISVVLIVFVLTLIAVLRDGPRRKKTEGTTDSTHN